MTKPLVVLLAWWIFSAALASYNMVSGEACTKIRWASSSISLAVRGRKMSNKQKESRKSVVHETRHVTQVTCFENRTRIVFRLPNHGLRVESPPIASEQKIAHRNFRIHRI